MASVKKTRKASATKQAKQPGIRNPKAKASKRSAVSAETKAKKAAAARALAAKRRAVKKSTKGSTQKTKMKTNAKTKTAAASTSRATPPATKNKSKTVAKAPATKKTAVTERRGKAALASASATKRIAAAKSAEAARQAGSSKPAGGTSAAPAKKPPVHNVSHGKAAKPAAIVRAVADAKPRNMPKPAATKEAAAALLAFKRNVARLSEMRKQAADAPAAQPVVTNSDAPLEKNERMAVIKDSNKKISGGPGAQTDTVRVSEKDSAVQETARAASKAAAMPVEAKIAPKVLASKPAPSLEASPVAAAAAQANLAAAKPAEKPAAPASKPVKTGSSQRPSFKPGEYVVYPAHGVGQIVAIEEQEVAGFKLELFVISFIKDKMILKVPTPKVASVGMRKLSDAAAVKTALDTLAGRARVKRTMWSRRAQEYEAKINSGDLNAIAEVVRDLYRSDMQPEQSYSERQLYEAALDRMTRELLVVQKLTETESLKIIEAQLQKGPRRGKTEDIDSEDAEIEEAA